MMADRTYAKSSLVASSGLSDLSDIPASMESARGKGGEDWMILGYHVSPMTDELAERAVAHVYKIPAARAYFAMDELWFKPKPRGITFIVYRRPKISVAEFQLAVSLVNSEMAGFLRSVVFGTAPAAPSRTSMKIVGLLARAAGPDQEAWAQEWPAHLASLEPSRRRPFQVVFYTTGFAVAAVKWRVSSMLRRPSQAIGKAVDKALGSDSLCSLTSLAAVWTATQWTDEQAGPAAAVVVLVSTTAASLTAVNQGRKMRGIKKKRKNPDAH